MDLRRLSKSVLVLALSLLSGCAAMQTAIEHRNLENSTQLSKSIFLEPIPASQKSIYVSVKNTSDEVVDIQKPLINQLKTQGYRVVQNPKAAHYVLQANILKIGKMSYAASQDALGAGYGAALVGVGTGVSVGALTGSGNAMIGGGLIGGAVSYAADSLV